ncbi:MAG TPA: D-TA family PLP-dependent enzyme [Methylomirabilota bacterium]|nr:D-TA family PLP-dependent enzyme [Methylomirabilota bacterium]
MTLPWTAITGEAEIPSPALVIDLGAVRENVEQMIRIAGGASRLRPHIKTHKLLQLVQLQVSLGISKAKCATIAEAELAALGGCTDILLANQPVGPNAGRLAQLAAAFPDAQFRTIIDDARIARPLSAAASRCDVRIGLLIDLDVGQHRTGIAPGPEALQLAKELTALPQLTLDGLHAYDGHIHQTDLASRRAAADEARGLVLGFRDQLRAAGIAAPLIVIGGTPTFPMHAASADVECSPGTSVLWDAGYATRFPDLDFKIAAAILTRVLSRPLPNRVCLDLGHKAVASEMPHPRVFFPALPDAQVAAHNEEHLVLETAQPSNLRPGDLLYGIPWHICPTMALHNAVHIVRNGRLAEEWPVMARQRKLTF